MADIITGTSAQATGGSGTPDSGAQPGGHEDSASSWYNPFSWGKKTKSWEVDPRAYAYETGVPNDWNQGAAQMSGMQFGNDVRGQQVDMMNLLAQRARGQNLASAAMAQQQLAAGQGAIQSQQAGVMRGGYDPAAARAAMYATGQLSGNVAGSAMTAAAQEQMAAAQAMGTMGQGVRGSDITQGLGAQGLAMQLRQMGMQDKMADLQARIMQEQAMKDAYMGQTTSGGIGPALGTAAGTLIGGYASGWDPKAMQAGASMGGSMGGALGDA